MKKSITINPVAIAHMARKLNICLAEEGVPRMCKNLLTIPYNTLRRRSFKTERKEKK